MLLNRRTKRRVERKLGTSRSPRHVDVARTYEKKKAALEQAIDRALEQAVQSGDFDRLQNLMERIRRATQEYREL